jgi:hypothetical protein
MTATQARDQRQKHRTSHDPSCPSGADDETSAMLVRQVYNLPVQ